MNRGFLSCWLAGVAVALSGAVWGGWETSGGDPALLQLSPPAATVSAGSSTGVLFTVEGGAPPYTWAVTNASLGTVASADSTAIYTSSASSGTNTLIVTDSDFVSASATIMQY
jgi:hypothetical protein